MRPLWLSKVPNIANIQCVCAIEKSLFVYDLRLPCCHALCTMHAAQCACWTNNVNEHLFKEKSNFSNSFLNGWMSKSPWIVWLWVIMILTRKSNLQCVELRNYNIWKEPISIFLTKCYWQPTNIVSMSWNWTILNSVQSYSISSDSAKTKWLALAKQIRPCGDIACELSIYQINGLCENIEIAYKL